MATQGDLNIIGWSVNVSGGGNITVQPLDELATNDLSDRQVIAWANVDGSAKAVIHGSFRVPKDYVGTSVLVIEWTSSTTSGNAVWDFDYRSIDVGESLDPSTWQESVSVTDAAPGTAWLIQEATISLTGSNFAADDMVEFQFGLDGNDASHTFTGVAVLEGLYFRYDDA